MHMPWSGIDQPRVPRKPFHSDLSDGKAKEEFYKADFLVSWKSVIIIAVAFVAFMILLYFGG